MCVDLGFFRWGHDQYTPQEWLKCRLYKTYFSTAKDDMLPVSCLSVLSRLHLLSSLNLRNVGYAVTVMLIAVEITIFKVTHNSLLAELKEMKAPASALMFTVIGLPLRAIFGS
jgi:hypothetical protein